MAERRSIHRKVSTSDDLADLGEAHGGWAVVFAISLIPHYDRWGCVPASNRVLRSRVMPSHDAVTAAMIGEWVEWMVEHGMLIRVTGPNGDEGLRNPRFEEHQRGAYLDREAPSPFEPPEVTERYASTRTDRSEKAPEPVEKSRSRRSRKPANTGNTKLRKPNSSSRATPEQLQSSSTERKGKEGKLNPSSFPFFPAERADTDPFLGGSDRLEPDGPHSQRIARLMGKVASALDIGQVTP